MCPTSRALSRGIRRSSAWRSACSIRARASRSGRRFCSAARRSTCGPRIPVEWFTADHETPGSEDLCFLTSSTPDEVVAHLKANGVTIEEGPVNKQGARGTLRSVYCRDPDGSLIEISSYAADLA